MEEPFATSDQLTIAAIEPETELVTSYWLAAPDNAPFRNRSPVSSFRSLSQWPGTPGAGAGPFSPLSFREVAQSPRLMASLARGRPSLNDNPQ